MEIKVYFHTRFTNGNGIYTKVSVALDETMAFGTIVGDNGKVQAQKWPVCKEVNIIGLRRAGLYMEDELPSAWPGFDEATRNNIIACVEQLPRSFQRLCENVTLSQQNMIDVHNHIRSLKRTLQALSDNQAMLNNAATTISMPAVDWRQVDVTQIALNDAQALLDEFSIDPTRVVVKGTAAYRTVNGVIETRPATTIEIAQADAQAYEKQRKTIYMAMFKPGKAIGEFEEGNLYSCRKEGGYAVLQINGQSRKINIDRLNCYDVFDEPPKDAKSNATASEEAMMA